MKPLKICATLWTVAALCAACSSRIPQNVTLTPAPQAQGINPDTHLVLAFTDTPTLGDSGL